MNAGNDYHGHSSAQLLVPEITESLSTNPFYRGFAIKQLGFRIGDAEAYPVGFIGTIPNTTNVKETGCE